MKKTTFIAYAFFCFCLSACQKQVESILPSTEEGMEEISLRSDNEREIFEGRLQWVAYVTAKLICTSPPAQMELFNKLDGTHTVDLKELIGDDVDENISPFKAGFLNYLYLNYTPGRPTIELDIPGIMPPQPSDSIDMLVLSFLDYMIKKNCVELYFPNGLSTDKIAVVTSTAHPLTDQDFNDGLRRYCSPIFKKGAWTTLEWVTVDPSYVRDYEHIVVARPFRAPFHLLCAYPQYEPTDFTWFLNTDR